MNFLQFNVKRLMGFNVEDALDSRAYKGGSKKQTTTSTSTPYQQGNYNELLSGASSWLHNGGFDPNYGGDPNFDPVADQNALQLGGIEGLGNLGGALQSLLGSSGVSSLADYLGPYDPNKTGLANAIGAANEQMQWDFDTTVRPDLRAGATNAGQYGSSRAGVAEGIATARLLQNQQNNASQLAFQDQQAYNQNRLNTLGNLSAIAKGLGSGNAMQVDAGSMLQNQEQQEINGALQKWAYENNVSLNDLLAYKELISGDMGGTNVSVTKGSGGGGGGLGSALGALGGASLGALFGGPAGASVGMNAGGRVGGLLF
ncbi:hypothetical protein [Pseudomonas phage ZCPS1]|uniref:Particle protein n=1 Tax=Pseudomonas phage Epa1 TaxID=2719568 RepID=A0A6G9LID6_9CAUD|nr:hypothetical protein [Klebsiella pneumoniae]AFD10694.1 hypothetical protein I7C_016 [Pseudomonas phage MR299-2]QIQ64384.1 hypothetical protein Epa1_p16 [Pseudomonas phage Epa1]QIQ66485.1 particle protein [Pseudomonas phage clash]QIQ67456.1 particle protein [Pseudomonas phage otherone]UPO63088.1 hypothetical protein [Pseudomonas phage ZCPS1]